MSHPIKANVVTLTFVQDNESRIYLQKRENTGFKDGYYDVPSGKVDEGESLTRAAQRELFEESGIAVTEADLECFHAYLNTSTQDNPFIGFMFRAAKWGGVPENKEPHKCSEAGFYELEQTQRMRLTPMVRDGLAYLATEAAISVSHYRL